MDTNTPIKFDVVKKYVEELNIPDLSNATIREIVKVVDQIEEATDDKFIRMEMGVPGLEPEKIGTEAEIEALKAGVAKNYPSIEGIPELKKETSRFIKSFMNIDVSPEGCIATTGSMQGGYASFQALSFMDKKKDTALFIDPGFPIQKQQFKVIGAKFESFDVYNYRGEKLREKLEGVLSKGNINSIIFSNPNNPSWICLNDNELQTIGELATKYDVIVVEDLAYFGMDFRKKLSIPNEPPFQPSVANYTDNWIMLISSSKVFSYAGQRMAVMVISDSLYHRSYPDLAERFGADRLGYAIVYRLLYSLSSGASHSGQYALAAMFKAASDGKFDFVEPVKEYGERAKIMKKLFTKYGFEIIYDKDLDEDLADGFYFTIAYPGMKGGELIENLLYYGISAISLKGAGSTHVDGLRACVSQIKRSQFDDLEYRLKRFAEEFK
ncbi:MAG: pyridoxal phosphate-dependent aminotransferase [Salinivirgaceae bacterium]|jgi:aspartate/methionine/tyrosine aminotransferase|nr:pyridoxal phosphate-dependent aminotransferase [Salinivirgaceae bacterium]